MIFSYIGIRGLVEVQQLITISISRNHNYEQQLLNVSNMRWHQQ